MTAIYTYDPLDRLATVVQKLGSGTISTQYGYDAEDNLTSVTDPNGNVTTYSYDDFHRLQKQVSPVTGTTTYSYDEAGNLTSTTDANAATTARTYDALSRVTSAVSSKSGSASETVSWTYDSATAGEFGIGRLASVSDPTGSTAYAYDRRGLLRSEQRTLGGASYTSSYTYDANGNRTSIVYPTSGSATYTYDYANRPVTLASVITAASYLPFGPLTSLTYNNGATKTVQYDARYRITENKLASAAATLADYTYSYDAAGNILSIHDAVDATYNRDFAYDDLNRLVTANTGASLWGTGSYAYDAMGNLTSRTLGTAPVSDPNNPLSAPRHARTAAVFGTVDFLAFTYTSTTPKISVATANGLDHTVAYDAAGNETQYYAARSYSPRNLLASVTDTSGEEATHTISYGYDARGVRVSRTESPTPSGNVSRYYFYTPELQLLETTVDDADNVWAQRASIMSTGLAASHEFGWFNGAPVTEFGPPRTPDSNVTLSIRRRTGTTTAPATTLYYTFTDHLGTPLLQIDGAANVVWRAEYEPYGNVWQMRTGARPTSRCASPDRISP